MLNKVHLIGNLGADPEIRTTQGGTAVGNLRVATSERVKRGDNWEDHTEWHRVVVWGKTAENVARYCKKGRQLYIEGKIRTKKWQDNQGNDRWSTEIVADVVRFLAGGRGDDRDQGGGYGSQGGYSQATDYGGRGPQGGSGQSGGQRRSQYDGDRPQGGGGGGGGGYQGGGPDDDIPF
jgi:single-strand DNA-binding protein